MEIGRLNLLNDTAELRVYFDEPDGRFLARVQRLKLATTGSTSLLPQLAIARFIESGGYEQHLRRIRAADAGKMAAMAAWQDHILGGNAVQWDAVVAPVCEKLKAEMGKAEFERAFAAGRSMRKDLLEGAARGSG